MPENINRIKVVLVEKQKTRRWLDKQQKRNPVTISRWCISTFQSPSQETLLNNGKCLGVKLEDLVKNPL